MYSRTSESLRESHNEAQIFDARHPDGEKSQILSRLIV